MFIMLSKIGWFLAQPVTLLLILMLLALLMLLLGWRRRAFAALLIASLFLALCAFTTFGYLLIGPLEARFTRPAEMPAAVDGIIVLGGGMDADVNNVRGGYELNRSGDRFTEALRLALLYPDARIAISGGTGVLVVGTDSEADAGARFFLDFGIPANRLILENEARNTEENAQFLKETVQAAPGETWLLVTSAFHMPRSVGLFRKAGFDVVPWPADYLSTGAEGVAIKLDQPAENLSVSTMALREWMGLLVYWLTGRIDAFVPAPD
jgi:uncharacterized SAM-binding protein YcdF (DUF218 family)